MPDDARLSDPSDPALDDAYRALFAPYEHVPVWLYHPARPLARAEQPQRSVADRLADLQQMAQEIDRIYRDYLPALFGAGGSPMGAGSPLGAASGAAWTSVLARWVETLNRRAASLYEQVIAPELAQTGFEIMPVAQALDQHGEWLRDYFYSRVYPLLTPLAVDPGRPFPYISSDSLNLLVELREGSAHEPDVLLARLKMPRVTPRLIRLPDHGQDGLEDPIADPPPSAAYVWSADLVENFVPDLFVGMSVHQVFCFRLLRAHDAGPGNQTLRMQDGRAKRIGAVVRVDVESGTPPRVVNWLLEHLDVASHAVVRHDAPLALMSLPQLAAEVNAWLGG